MKKLSLEDLEDLEVESFAIQPSEGELALVMGGGNPLKAIWNGVKWVYKQVSGSGGSSSSNTGSINGNSTNNSGNTIYDVNTGDKYKNTTVNNYNTMPCDSAYIFIDGEKYVYKPK